MYYSFMLQNDSGIIESISNVPVHCKLRRGVRFCMHNPHPHTDGERCRAGSKDPPVGGRLFSRRSSTDHPAASMCKRPRLAAPEDHTLLIGMDSALPDDEKLSWQEDVERLCRAGEQFSDGDFPAAQVSISGKENAAENEPPPPPSAPPVPGATPKCRCGTDASSATVQRDTPNKGRQYFRCPARKCGFFSWADGGEVAFRRGGSAAKLTWARMPGHLAIVSDFGFRAEDLLQGGVGDCWFMSALAVVAERHDLIANLFAADTARNAAGCYCLRLFLDGQWSSVVIDDLLPVTAAPRREQLAFDTRLAFCRCGSASGAQQLWASLVEKAYAKAHGSYQAISGGWVAEALLDLTGGARRHRHRPRVATATGPPRVATATAAAAAPAPPLTGCVCVEGVGSSDRDD